MMPANKRQAACISICLFEGYRISVCPALGCLLLPTYETNINWHPGHPPHRHPETSTVDVCGSVTFGSQNPAADIVHLPQAPIRMTVMQIIFHSSWVEREEVCIFLQIYFRCFKYSSVTT